MLKFYQNGSIKERNEKNRYHFNTFLRLPQMQYQNSLTSVPLSHTAIFLIISGIYRKILVTGNEVTLKQISSNFFKL